LTKVLNIAVVRGAVAAGRIEEGCIHIVPECIGPGAAIDCLELGEALDCYPERNMTAYDRCGVVCKAWYGGSSGTLLKVDTSGKVQKKFTLFPVF
jgi:hypothetical protein